MTWRAFPDHSYKCQKCGNPVRITTNNELVLIYCPSCRTSYDITTGDLEVALNVAVEKGYIKR